MFEFSQRDRKNLKKRERASYHRAQGEETRNREGNSPGAKVWGQSVGPIRSLGRSRRTVVHPTCACWEQATLLISTTTAEEQRREKKRIFYTQSLLVVDHHSWTLWGACESRNLLLDHKHTRGLHRARGEPLCLSFSFFFRFGFGRERGERGRGQTEATRGGAPRGSAACQDERGGGGRIAERGRRARPR